MKRPPVVKSPFWSGNVPDLQDALSFFSSLAPRYGEVCAFRTFRQWRYYVQNPDLIQQILTSHQWVRTPISRKLLGSFLGESVFSQEGDLHLSQRRLMQPRFPSGAPSALRSDNGRADGAHAGELARRRTARHGR